MSFHEAGSDLARLNRARPGDRVSVDARTAQVLRCAEALRIESAGAFDCAVADALIAAGLLPSLPEAKTMTYGDIDRQPCRSDARRRAARSRRHCQGLRRRSGGRPAARARHPLGPRQRRRRLAPHRHQVGDDPPARPGRPVAPGRLAGPARPGAGQLGEQRSGRRCLAAGAAALGTHRPALGAARSARRPASACRRRAA